MGWGERIEPKEQGETMLNPEHFPESQRKIINLIEKLRGKGGEEYAGSTELARRNPVKDDTGPLLTFLAQNQNPLRILEMGTAYGLSAAYLALGAPNARIVTVEFDAEVAEEAQANLDGAEINAEVFPGTVTQYAAQVDGGKFGAVFIDHDKKSYLPDFLAVKNQLVPGALVVADNVNDRRAETSDFVEYMYAHFKPTILPTQAGLLVAQV